VKELVEVDIYSVKESEDKYEGEQAVKSIYFVMATRDRVVLNGNNNLRD